MGRQIHHRVDAVLVQSPQLSGREGDARSDQRVVLAGDAIGPHGRGRVRHGEDGVVRLQREAIDADQRPGAEIERMTVKNELVPMGLSVGAPIECGDAGKSSLIDDDGIVLVRAEHDFEAGENRRHPQIESPPPKSWSVSVPCPPSKAPPSSSDGSTARMSSPFVARVLRGSARGKELRT